MPKVNWKSIREQQRLARGGWFDSTLVIKQPARRKIKKVRVKLDKRRRYGEG